jgi:hypothetical protein
MEVKEQKGEGERGSKREGNNWMFLDLFFKKKLDANAISIKDRVFTQP